MADNIIINGFTYSADMATVIAVDKDIMSLDGMQRGVRYIGKGAFAGCGNLRVVRLPETVIRIGDFAFRDCTNLREVHFPYYMEYISPLAFTNTGIDKPFYNLGFKTCIPKDAYLKFTYMIPQFISERNHEEYGLTTDDLESVDGWDDFEGLPVYVNEDELYRMAIQNDIQDEYMVGEFTELDSDKVANDIRDIYNQIRNYLFEEGICEFQTKTELANIETYQIVNNVDASFGALIAHNIKSWLKHVPEKHPMEILYKTVEDSMLMGFMASILWDEPNDEELYGDGLFYYLLFNYGEGFEAFYREVVQGNEILQAYYDKLQVDVHDVLEHYFLCYMHYGYPINVQSLRSIIRQCMKLMFHVGYGYGYETKYSNK